MNRDAGVQIVTARLLLREFAESDFTAVHHYASDPEVVRYTGFGPNSEEDTREFLRRCAGLRESGPRTEFPLAIVVRAGDGLIGGCGLHSRSGKDSELEMGYVLAREHWGQGYASETAWALLGFGFEELELHRIVAWCDPVNVASARVMEKAGMRREGHLREDRRRGGEWRDSLLYAILEHEWREANRAASRQSGA